MSRNDASHSTTIKPIIGRDPSSTPVVEPSEEGLQGLSLGIGIVIGIGSTLLLVGIAALLVWLIVFKKTWKKKDPAPTTVEAPANPAVQQPNSTETCIPDSHDSKAAPSSSAAGPKVVVVPRTSVGGIMAVGVGAPQKTAAGAASAGAKSKPKKSTPPASTNAKNKKKTYGGSEFIGEEPSNVWKVGFEKENIVPPAAPTPPTPTKKKDDKKVDVQFSSSEDSIIGEEGRTAQPKKNALRGYMTLRQREIEKMEKRKKKGPSPKTGGEKSSKSGKSTEKPQKPTSVKPEKEKSSDDGKSKAGGKSDDGADGKDAKSAENADKEQEQQL